MSTSPDVTTAGDGSSASQPQKATKSTAATFLTSRLDKIKQKNAERPRDSHAKVQDSVIKEKQPPGDNAVAASGDGGQGVTGAGSNSAGAVTQSSVRSTFGSIRSRLSRIQQEGIGGHRTLHHASSTTAETVAADTTVAEPGQSPKAPEGVEDEPSKGEITKQPDTVKDEPSQDEPSKQPDAVKDDPSQDEPSKHSDATKTEPSQDESSKQLDAVKDEPSQDAPSKQSDAIKTEPTHDEIIKQQDTVDKPQDPVEAPKQPDAVIDEPTQGETNKSVAADNSTAEEAIAEGGAAASAANVSQAVGEKSAKPSEQPAQAGGSKSVLGSLRSRLDKIQQDSATRAREAHKAATDKKQGNGAGGLKSAVGTIRAKLDKIQQESVERARNPQERKATTATDGGGAGRQALKSSVGTIRARVKEIQEKNAARAKAASTNGAQKTPAGIFKPVDEAIGDIQPTAAEVKED